MCGIEGGGRMYERQRQRGYVIVRGVRVRMSEVRGR